MTDDGNCNLADLSGLADLFAAGSGVGSVVPEPTGLLLLSIGLACTLIGTRRRVQLLNR